MLLGQLADIPEAAVSNLDLLLRWAVLRMCDGNTQCLLKVLEMCKALLELCQQMVGGGVLQARLLADMSRPLAAVPVDDRQQCGLLLAGLPCLLDRCRCCACLPGPMAGMAGLPACASLELCRQRGAIDVCE